MPVSPRTVAREVNRIREVFLSATAKDVATYRTNVKEALSLVRTAVFLQEEWAVPAAGVVTMCLNRLRESDAYVGVFGYRYGWIPDGYQTSITEVECEGALKLWGRMNVPPIFFFVPEPGSVAATELDEAAAQILAQDYPGDTTKWAESRQQQKAFCNRLRSSGRFAGSFCSAQDLRERAIASVSNWNVEILQHAGDRQRSALTQIPPSELGAIGRKDQRDALENAWLALQESDAPGMCVIVHGGEDSGQFAFLAFLESWEGWDLSGRPHLITPPHDRFDAASVRAAALAEIAPDRASPTASVDELAHAIVDRCRDEPLVMFLSQIERMDGGLEQFQQAVWKPVFAAVLSRRQAVGSSHPFVLVAALTSPLQTPLPSCVWPEPLDAASIDYERLLPLPKLEGFTSLQVADWLRDRGVGLKDRKQITERVTKDGVPRAVFDRLNAESLGPVDH